MTVSANTSDATSGIYSAVAKYNVVDEHGLVQPSGTITVNADGTCSFTVSLKGSFNAGDTNGRQYTIRVSVKDWPAISPT